MIVYVRKFAKHIILITMLFFIGFNVAAQSDLSGYEVMSKVFQRPQPTELRGTLEMTLKSRIGDEQTRNAVQIIGTYEGVEKKILFITSPPLIRNTAFMSFNYNGEENEQWIYLPALGSPRRIASSDRNKGLMGSDFAFNDLVQRHPDRDSHTVIGIETLHGRKCYIVESVFPEEGASYGRIVTWVAEGIWIGLRREFYDTKSNLVKSLDVNKLEQVGPFWTISDMTMTTHKSGHSTNMKLSDLTIETGFAENDFSVERMKLGLD